MSGAFDLAAQQIGLNESAKAPALQEFLRNGGQNLDPAVTAWCAAFVDATLQQSGGQGTGKLNARSYLDWGSPVNEPQRGDVAVFSRGDPNGWQGHVGFFDGYDEAGNVRVLGGNQGDAVSVSTYDKSKLLGFRRAGEGSPSGQAPQGGYTGQQQPQNQLAGAGPSEQPQAPEFRMQNTLQDARAFQMQPQNQLAQGGFGAASNPFLSHLRTA